VVLVVGLGLAVMVSIELLKAWLAARKPVVSGMARVARR
jgi:hypothetical protein